MVSGEANVDHASSAASTISQNSNRTYQLGSNNNKDDDKDNSRSASSCSNGMLGTGTKSELSLSFRWPNMHVLEKDKLTTRKHLVDATDFQTARRQFAMALSNRDGKQALDKLYKKGLKELQSMASVAKSNHEQVAKYIQSTYFTLQEKDKKLKAAEQKLLTILNQIAIRKKVMEQEYEHANETLMTRTQREEMEMVELQNKVHNWANSKV